MPKRSPFKADFTKLTKWKDLTLASRETSTKKKTSSKYETYYAITAGDSSINLTLIPFVVKADQTTPNVCKTAAFLNLCANWI